MPDSKICSALHFVFRSCDLKPSTLQDLHSTGVRTICDFTAPEGKRVSPSLYHSPIVSGVTDLKIAPDDLMEPRLVPFLQDRGIGSIWVELHPALLQRPLAEYLDRMSALSDTVSPVPIVGSMELLARITREYPRIEHVALKGNEASGPLGCETLFTLYASARRFTRELGHSPQLSIWGGLGTPEAVAAFLCTGAGRVVFESLHWLTDAAGCSDRVREKLKGLRPDHTELLEIDPGISFRLYNKGNSLVVRKLKARLPAGNGGEAAGGFESSFARKAGCSPTHPFESGFGREEFIALGVEAAYAAAFENRYGGHATRAIGSFVNDIEKSMADATRVQGAFCDSPAARDLGTRYPFIQGGMSCITDVPEFARQVAEAGGLPTLALGMMDERLLEEKLGRLPEVMGSLPYAINVITLPENPHRQAQLSWIRKIRPPFIVIAAGEPIHGKELLADGLKVIYVTSSPDLLKLAVEMGIRFVVCEGHESGGHIGRHSTLTLAQELLHLKYADPALFGECRLILAGGICNRETAFMAAMLGADALQMGTAYLATEEIVGTGALTGLYQRMILDAQPGSTVVTGESTGLRIRSLKTPKTDAILSLEKRYASGLCDESSFRCEIEGLAVRSLLIAAKGVDRPAGDSLDERHCLREGQFMSGACSGCITEAMSLEKLHREIAQGELFDGVRVESAGMLGPGKETPNGERAASPAGLRSPAPARGHSVSGNGRSHERIAITGMSALNALGKSAEDIWAACVAMKSGITAVPPSRWDSARYYHPEPGFAEKTYCKVGAFQQLDVSRKEVGIAPQDFNTMSYATRLTLWLASRAVESSGVLAANVPPERVAVLISQNSGEVASTLKDITIRGSIAEITAAVKRVIPMDPEVEKAVVREITAGRLAVDDTTLLGRLNCAAAGFVCNRYGFEGPSYSVSAACATSFAALFSAVQMMRNGLIDAAVIGGGEELLTPMHFIEFSAIGALAGLSGVERLPAESSRPFDRGRDGMVLGEGGGMIVLELESTARKRGAKIHGYITGIGACNNASGMVESARKGQELAIRASFAGTGYAPDEVDLVECHATGTHQGDIEEIGALRTFFGSHKRTVLSSFKSQIGHTLGASGINSLIRGVSAMKAGTFPPTLNCSDPDLNLGLNGSGLGIRREPEEWRSKNGAPRRFQVNAFGFGGSNYVVQLEESRADEDVVLVSIPGNGDSAIRADDRREEQADLPEGVYFFTVERESETDRIAIVAESEAKAVELMDETGVRHHQGPMTDKKIRSLARRGLHSGSSAAPIPGVAFVFPGQGSQYGGMGYELYREVPAIRKSMDRAQQVAGFDLLHLLFHDDGENLRNTRWQQPALYALEYAIGDYLLSLEIVPKAMAGHSLGELTALCLAGVYSFEDGFRIVNKRAVCMESVGSGNGESWAMMATDAPVALLEELTGREGAVYITNYNGPRQTVVGGTAQGVESLRVHLGASGFRCTLLPVSMAFHSPVMRAIRDELASFVEGIPFHPPKIPVISNTTRLPFPSDAAEIRSILMAHLECPVYWEQNIQSLRSEFDVETFIEVGPRDVLGSLISDISKEADCIKTCMPSAETLVFRNALARLFALGHLRVPSRRFPRAMETAAIATRETPSRVTPGPIPRAVVETSDKLRDIVQQEVNSFVLNCFGQYLTPRLLERIREEYDARFDERDLEGLLRRWNTSGKPPGLPPAETGGSSPALAVAKTGPEHEEAPEPRRNVPVESEEVLEAVIEVVMQTTGYDRDEIEPGMDLREDLSIRSSRLPVVMDALEGRFGIRVDIQDFIGVRTIMDVAERVAMLAARGDALPPGTGENTGATGLRDRTTSPESIREISRVVFRETPLEPVPPHPVSLSPGGSVAVFSTFAKRQIGKEAGDVLRRDYGVDIADLTYLSPQTNWDDGDGNGDLRTAPGKARLVESLQAREALEGLVFIVDDSTTVNETTAFEETFSVLCGFFAVLQQGLKSPGLKFVTVIDSAKEARSTPGPLVEGILGILLCSAIECDKVLFRVVRLEGESELKDAVRLALNADIGPVELIYREGRAFTTEGRVSPSPFQESHDLHLGPEDVVVCSGGGSGITPYLLQSFVPFGCKMVLLGRTALEPISGDREIPDTKDAKIAESSKVSEILSTVQRLNGAGLETIYLQCDVSDPEQTADILAGIAARFGRISGIVHGAGIIRDGFLQRMSPEDFSSVARIKMLGAWNLFQASRNSGLKFFVGLSSAASIQGNPGQANYAAGNRAMTALLSLLHRADPSVTCKALMLPPLSGAGMADNAEVRALLERTNAAYVHVEELAGFFPQELFSSSKDETAVMFMRSLPELPTAPRIVRDPKPHANTLLGGATMFQPEEFPLVDTVSTLDPREMTLLASRSFSERKDLWLPEHKPFKRLEHPLLSAIMGLETMMEASRILFPHLNVHGMRDARFLYPVECPQGGEVACRVACRCVQFRAEEVVCSASLTATTPSAAGLDGNRSTPNFTCSVLLGGNGPAPFGNMEGFPVSPAELNGRPMGPEQVELLYREGTGLEGRYRVIESVDGASFDAVRGRMIYTPREDFSTFSGASYQYSPYLLEGLLHILNFHHVMREERQARSMIPHGIGEMTFSRRCSAGESFLLEARLRERTDLGCLWDARALDESGNIVMHAGKIEMRWF